MGTIIKTVKQYSYELDDNDLNELLFIGEHYRNAKNYIFSRYSGINSLPLIMSARKIRDEWVKSGFYRQWNLPSRYWKLALEECFANIKSQWSNIKRNVKETAFRNPNLSNDDKYYINYMLKSNILYQKILVRKKFDLPNKFKDLNLNIKRLNNLLRRLTRKLKKKIPYTTKATFSIDTGLYLYKDGVINITCAKKGKRVPVKLTDNNIYDRTMKVKFVGKKLEIHCPLKIKTKKNKNKNVVGIDKGYKHLLATSENNLYGENLNTYLSTETERLNKVNKNRVRLYAVFKKHEENNNTKKAENILKNNLGKVKYNKNKRKHKESVKSYINHSINMFLEAETPKEIVMEQLDFVNWDNRYSKNVKRKLSRWIKGYIRERLEYKCDLYQIDYTYINPAYTSKICNICGAFGTRNADVFECCNCGKTHADINASKNILNRKYDKEISTYTPYKKVKEILKSRI